MAMIYYDKRMQSTGIEDLLNSPAKSCEDTCEMSEGAR